MSIIGSIKPAFFFQFGQIYSVHQKGITDYEFGYVGFYFNIFFGSKLVFSVLMRFYISFFESNLSSFMNLDNPSLVST